MYDTYMSTPGNTAKLGATHSSIQTAQRGPSLVGSEREEKESERKKSEGNKREGKKSEERKERKRK